MSLLDGGWDAGVVGDEAADEEPRYEDARKRTWRRATVTKSWLHQRSGSQSWAAGSCGMACLGRCWCVRWYFANL